MATTRSRHSRKSIADQFIEDAVEAQVVVKQILTGEISGGDTSNRLGAAKLIINKVCPDLRAVELKGDINITNQEFIIGGEDDTSQA